jgi:hypothetical protein
LIIIAQQKDARFPREAALREDQTVRELDREDFDWLAALRAKAEAFLDGSLRAAYQGIPGKLGLISAILEADAFRPDQTFELQGLGIILGDALAAHLGMEWRMMEDQYGTSPCLVLNGTSIILFPQTMISKRVERGETVDVLPLFDGIVAKIEELRGKGA